MKRGIVRLFNVTEVLSISPHAMANPIPLATAAGFFFATFIFEDVATIGAGLLLATGNTSWFVAFISCFLGVWLGDASLYALARLAGRNWFEKSPLGRFAPRVARSERWFEKRGTPILIFSHAVPGARLPTYFAAGFLRVPPVRFFLVTGSASLAWTIVVLFVAETFGERLTHWLNAYRHAGLLLLAVAAVVFIVLQLFRRVAIRFGSRRRSEVGERMPER